MTSKYKCTAIKQHIFQENVSNCGLFITIYPGKKSSAFSFLHQIMHDEIL